MKIFIKFKNGMEWSNAELLSSGNNGIAIEMNDKRYMIPWDSILFFREDFEYASDKNEGRKEVKK